MNTPSPFSHRQRIISTLLCLALPALTFGCGKKNDNSDEKNEKKKIKTVHAIKRRLSSTINLPGNLKAYQDVPIHAKVEGYIAWIGVDRGSIVRKGQKLITIEAPEVNAKVEEAWSRAKSAEATYAQANSALDSVMRRIVEAKAKRDADALTYSRLKQAYEMYPPAIAKNDLDTSEKAVEADNARLQALKAEGQSARNMVASEKENARAAMHLHDALKAMRGYLDVVAPFNGIITERNVHQGSIVSVSAGRTNEILPLLRIQQCDPLRLVVAVPELGVPGVKLGEKIPFSVDAYPDRIFKGEVVRPSYALENTTRTMPVELNYSNPKYVLQPGMYASVKWPLTRPYDTVFVPQSSVKSNLKESFVDKVVDGKIKKTKVDEGQTMGNWVEVMGNIKTGDEVALKANDELKTGTKVDAKPADREEIANASEKGGGEE